MELYRHTQPGHVIRAAMLIGVCVIAGISVATAAVPHAWMISALMGIVLLFALALFHSLTVTVDRERFGLSFGPGLIRKSWPMESIAEWKVVRNPWYYGWGIHLTPHGWLYNVSGFHAVEIKLRDGKRFRIGADAPEELTQALTRCKASS